ncbi:aldehyde dehydrogenase (NAD+) [Parafrankia irregularis]|uniref:Aldehyde dehydrogenase n=1 Tax=Parafrankia irregularis TaxID=795642 RepID=A0A0S4QQX7_9ACTN|nr:MULTISPECIES: aldehyde dehydrogenase family protein [Parafrankia]MBE3199848.1 aldehyde dehydrogenase family protein [Parafrankia sp. CH37]CUU58000.1 aldehyde dehydrogenase (NAD+) [Parafrankia irregularis]
MAAQAAEAKFESRNPATDEVVGTFAVMSADEVAAAVRSARSARSAWQAAGFAGRRAALLRWAAWLAAHEHEIVDLVHAENGKPAIAARLELLLTCEHIRWAARNARPVLRERRVRTTALMIDYAARVGYLPYGVVGVIGPWNYPLLTPTGSLAYALAAGNTVVFKPSELTSALGLLLVEGFTAANPELPDGVLVGVTGGGETGTALCRAGVDKIAFTGSGATARKVLATCAATLTPVVAECGGKDAAIVAEDADIAAAARMVAWGAASNAGQTCAGVERVYVVAGVRDAFLTELGRQLADVRPGSDPQAAYGPMTMPGQADVVRRHVADALARGGSALLGGPQAVRGRFVDPIVLVDVPEDSAAVQEETFGPTMTVRTVADVDEAVALANDSRYGLGAAVFSRARGGEIAGRLDAGMVSVNSVLSFAAIPALPFGGRGESGFGRIHGADGLREFARPRSVAARRPGVRGLDVTRFDPYPGTSAVLRAALRVRHRGAPTTGSTTGTTMDGATGTTAGSVTGTTAGSPAGTMAGGAAGRLLRRVRAARR